jgi:hypothetical protein
MTGRETFAGIPVTTAVCEDRALGEPAGLMAVTATRIVEPVSPEESTWVDAVAPAIATQLAPEALQSYHW